MSSGRGRAALLISDLLTYWLTGETADRGDQRLEHRLVRRPARKWSIELMGRLGMSPDLFSPLLRPGETVGRLTSKVAERTGLPSTLGLVPPEECEQAHYAALKPQERPM